MRKKLIFAASLILLLLLAVNLLFRGGLFSESLKNFLTDKLEQELHASVRIGKVRLNLFPLFLNADELTLREKKETSHPLLKVDHLTVWLNPVSLFSKYLVFQKIQFLDPEIHLIWDENGKTNFDFLLKSTTPQEQFPLIIQKIVLLNAALDLDQQSQKKRTLISSLEIKAEADPTMTRFQIAGSSKEIFYQWNSKNHGLFSSSEWSIGISPQNIDIKKLSLASKEGSLSVKGIVNLIPQKGEYPFKIDADFHMIPITRRSMIDGISGHGQLIGEFNLDKNIAGNLRLDQMAIEKGKGSHNMGWFKGHFSSDLNSLRIDKFDSDLFGASLEGSLTLKEEENSAMMESEYQIRHFALDRMAFLLPSSEKKYLEGRILDASGAMKIKNLDLRQIKSSGHIHLARSKEMSGDPKKPFLENLLVSVNSAESDYQYDSLTLIFQNTALQVGASFLQGNGTLQKDGTLQSFFSLRAEKGGEIFSWLGLPQWSGRGEFSGEVRGKLSSPTLVGKGWVKEVTFENHSLGDGTTDLEYSDKRLLFSNTRVTKGKSVYTANGSVQWDSVDKFAYQISAQALHGIPDDIVSVFIDNIPLYTQGSGPVTIEGDNQTVHVKGNIDLENGTLYNESFDRGHVEFELTEKEILFHEASLSHGASTLSGKGRILFQGSYLGEIRSENLHLEDLTRIRTHLPGVAGSFKGVLLGEGTFTQPMIKLSGTLPDIAYNQQNLRDGTIEILIQDKKLQADLKFKDRPVQIKGSITLAQPFNSNFEIQGEQIPLIPLLAITSGSQLTSFRGTVSGQLKVEGPLSQLRDLNYSAYLNRLEADFAGYPVSNKGDLIFQLKDGTLNIDSFHLKGDGTALSITGGLQLFNQFNLFVTGEADLSLLKSLTRDVTYGQGKAYLALNIYDKWTDPKFQGGLTVQEGQIRTSFLQQPFNISSLGLFFNERQIFLESFDAALGEGAFHVTGKIDMNRFKMGHFGLMTEIRESRFTFFPGWASTVSGTLFYQGDLSMQTLQGELAVSHGIYNKKFDLKPLVKKLTEIRENRRQPIPVVGNTRMNIHLSGEDDLRVNNNVARLPFTADLTLKGTVDHPVLIGRMESDSGFIIFYNKTFTVSSVTVDFIDPENIKPLIDLKARTQIVGKDRNYQIDLGLSGTLEEFNRTLTADDPALTETDILSLILAGKKATEVATDPASQQQIGGSFVPLVIESPFEGLLEELTGVNRLSIEPVSPSLRSTGGPRVSVEEHLLNDKLLLNYSYIMNPTQDQLIQMDYLLNRHMYLQGIRNEDGTVGGNLKFRFEFK